MVDQRLPEAVNHSQCHVEPGQSAGRAVGRGTGVTGGGDGQHADSGVENCGLFMKVIEIVGLEDKSANDSQKRIEPSSGSVQESAC